MYGPGRRPVNGPLLDWEHALDRPGAGQMRHLRRLIESKPYFSRVPDQSLVADTLDGNDKIVATRGDGYALIYSAQGRKFTVNMDKVPGESVTASWFNPRTGTAIAIGEAVQRGPREFVCPSEGFGSDWVLVLEAASRKRG